MFVVQCLNDKLAGLDKAKAMMKAIFAESDMDATIDEVADGLGRAAGRKMCAGHQGWNFDPNYKNCKNNNYNDEGECEEYYCDNYDDCKTKCEATGLACNTNNDYWNPSNLPQTEAECLVDKLNNKDQYPDSAGGKFCARCWDGDSNCEEISEPSVCRLTRTGYNTYKWTAEQVRIAKNEVGVATSGLPLCGDNDAGAAVIEAVLRETRVDGVTALQDTLSYPLTNEFATRFLRRSARRPQAGPMPSSETTSTILARTIARFRRTPMKNASEPTRLRLATRTMRTRGPA